MKRYVCFLAVVLLLMAVLPAGAEEETLWRYDEGNACLRVSGTLSGDVVLPETVDSHIVNAIGSGAFYGQNGITSVTLPASMRAVQGGAFDRMDGLTQVALNDGLEYIGSAFSSCPLLECVTIPASVQMIDALFSNCSTLKEIRFEGACPVVLNPSFCFFMMPDEYTIYVPDDQLDAYAAAFAEANGAAEHLQPSGQNAVIPEQASEESLFLFDTNTGTITGYQGNRAIVNFPATIGGEQVKAIGAYAFSSDRRLYGITLPEGLETVEEAAFQHSNNIAYIQFPSTLTNIGDNAFFNVRGDRIDWNDALEHIGANAFSYNHLSVLELPKALKTIGKGAFEGSWCRELYLGGAVESIGSRAFAGTMLNYMCFDLYAPIDIASDAFADNHLADLDLPWDSSFENRDAFAALLKDQCPSCTVWINNPDSAGVAEYPDNHAETITFQNGVWTAYHGNTPNLTVWSGYDDIDVTALGDGLFKGNQTIRSFYPHHCGWFTTIGAEAFADSSVETVELFPSITTIGDSAFRNCLNLTELTIPASVTQVGKGILAGCANLRKLTVLCDPAILPDDTLTGCDALTEIYIAADATNEQLRTMTALAGRPWYLPVARVGQPAMPTMQEMPYAELPGDDFWYDEDYDRLDSYRGYELNLTLPRTIDGIPLTCIGGTMMNRASCGDNFDVELPVRSVVIPETYRKIAAYAFSNCTTLETVICYAPIDELPDGCFSGCTSLREVVFVNGVRRIGANAFEGCSSLTTLYLGNVTEDVSEYAFSDSYGNSAFSLAECLIEDPAQTPDVDALLSAVESAPLPAPAPEPEPEALEPTPIGAEGEPYFGAWQGESMVMGDMVFTFSDIGMSMNLTLNSDGTAILDDGEEYETSVWFMQDGAAWIDGSALILDEDGKLCMTEDGTSLYFIRGDDAGSAPAPAAPVAEPDTEPASSGLGFQVEIKYVMSSAEVQGITLSPEQMGGMEYSLVFHEAGTVDFVIAGTPVPGLNWTMNEAGEIVIDYYGTPLVVTLTGEGMDMNYFDAMVIHLVGE